MAMPIVNPHPHGNIKPGDNPYWHDTFNVGFPADDFLMDDNFENVEFMSYKTIPGKNERHFQIIDKETGERWIVTL